MVSYTPLHYAVWLNKDQIVQYLLTIEGIDANVAGSVGDRPLHLGKIAISKKIFAFLRQICPLPLHRGPAYLLVISAKLGAGLQASPKKILEDFYLFNDCSGPG